MLPSEPSGNTFFRELRSRGLRSRAIARTFSNSNQSSLFPYETITSSFFSLSLVRSRRRVLITNCDQSDFKCDTIN